MYCIRQVIEVLVWTIFVKPNDELSVALDSKQLHRNFQGYCTLRTTGQVYAFGVTGISQLGNAYAQNGRNITKYIGFDIERQQIDMNEDISSLRKNKWCEK